MPLPRRFQVSKFKNTTPKNPKKEECIFDLPIGTLSSGNNGIKSSSCLLAFHIDGEGGKLGVLPVGTIGRKLRTDLTVVCAHRDAVTDFDFFPFRTGLLATCSRDDKVKIWELSDQNGNVPSPASVGEPNGIIDVSGRVLECLTVHPTADGIFAAGADSGALICDAEMQTVSLEVNTGAEERVQCGSWQTDGRLLALIDKARSVHLFDPRSGKEPIATTKSHLGLGREGRVLFLGDTGRLLTSGFSKNRYREVFLYDVNNFTEPVHTKQFDSSTGLLMPLYDCDAKLLFLAGKGSNKVLLYELAASHNELLEVGVYTGSDQTLGACLVPKSALKVMEGEADRLMQLTKSIIFPISCIVPRKTYRDFHAELFPDTVCRVPGCISTEWLTGSNKQPPKFSLDPAMRDLMNVPSDEDLKGGAKVTNGFLKSETELITDLDEHGNVLSSEASGANETEFFTPDSAVGKSRKDSTEQFLTPADITPTTTFHFETPTVDRHHVMETTSQLSPPPKEKLLMEEAKTTEKESEQKLRSIQDIKKQLGSAGGEPGEAFKTEKDSIPVPVRDNRASSKERVSRTCVVGVRQSKYRHVTVSLAGNKGFFTNLRNVNTRLPPESNGFCVSELWAAVPLSGPAGIVAIFDLSCPQKIPDGVIPGLANKVAVTDLTWCPFDANQLAVGCENGTVNIWIVPDNGVQFMIEEPALSFQGFSDKVSVLRYHPVAKNVLATVSWDSVLIWNVGLGESCQEPKIKLERHGAPILCLAWSADGRKLGTVAKDRILRIFEPTNSTKPVVQESVLGSTRGARIFFACSDSVVATVSFSRSSDRQVSLYDGETLKHLHTLPVDTSPQLLIPTYDYDSSVLFLSGKGDVSVHMYEVVPESPWLIALNKFMAPNGHQAISIQQKNVCDVREVEFARGQRLTLNSIESVVFAVPRRRKDLFQNDLYPDSLVTWEPANTAEKWLAGEHVGPKFQSLKPNGMDLLYPENLESESPEESAKGSVLQKPNLKIEVVVNGQPKETEQFPKRPKQEKTVMVEKEGAEEIKKDIVESMSSQMDLVGEKELEQDSMEGVAEEEWHH